jgi:ubiquinone/menaquinone biosynthesis C-methylase UbiE
MMNTSDLKETPFSSPPARIDQMAGFALRALGDTQPAVIIDIGCGDGSLIFALRSHYQSTQIHGIDLSKPSITRAIQESDTRGFSDIHFHHGDYLETELPHADLIITDSTLHLIPVADATLWDRIQKNLKDGGVLVFSMPIAHWANTVLWFLRRLWRQLPRGLTDSLGLRIGKALHGGKLSEGEIRERLVYMRSIPLRIDNTSLRSELSAAGFVLIHEEREPFIFGKAWHSRLAWKYVGEATPRRSQPMPDSVHS